MLRLSWKIKGLCLVALLLACVIASAEAKAKAWGDDESNESDSWFDSEEEQEEAAGVKPSAVAGKSSDDHSNHDHHNHNQHQSMMNAPNSGAKQAGGGGGFQSGNYAAYNESCGPNRKLCIPQQNLFCSSPASDGIGRCICATGYVYVRSTETCWPISKSTEDPCSHDVQCHAGKFGEISRCSKHNSRCECYDYNTGGKRDAILVEGVCYIQKTPGDLCSSHEECDKAIKGGAYCQGGNYTGGGGNRNYTGSCQCRDSHTWYLPMEECLRKSVELNDPCVITQQCRQGNLGRWSWCNGQTARCECSAGSDNSTEAVYYRELKKCFLRKAYNETCEEDNECKASLGPDVVCGVIGEGSEEEKVCHCPKGKVCRSSGFSSILGASSQYTMGVACTAAVVGMTVTTMSMNGLGGGGGVMQMTSSGWW